MPLIAPRRVKFRKMFKGQMPGNANSGNQLAFGEYGLKAMTRSWISARQIESARKTLTHFTAKGGRVWIRIFPDKPIVKKAPGTRMGSGKGDVEMYVCVVKPGRILFEMGGIPEADAAEAIRRAGFKLPIKTKFITKETRD
mgnify:CR=1 FL=1